MKIACEYWQMTYRYAFAHEDFTAGIRCILLYKGCRGIIPLRACRENTRERSSLNIVDIFGKKYTREQIENYVGRFRQVAGSRKYRLSEGKAEGVRGVDVNAGNGFHYTVLPDRCMDISLCSYKGINLVYQGETEKCILPTTPVSETIDERFLQDWLPLADCRI